MILQTTNGYPELVLMEACGVDIFYVTADWLTKKLGVAYSEKISQGEMIRWEFYYSNTLMMLRYNSKAGVILCPAACQKATEIDKAAFNQLSLLL